NVVEFGENLVCWSIRPWSVRSGPARSLAASRLQLLIGTHNETFSVAMRVNILDKICAAGLRCQCARTLGACPAIRKLCFAVAWLHSSCSLTAFGITHHGR